MVIKMMSSDKLRNLSIGFANILGFEKLLPLVESEEIYVKVPMELAERLGEKITNTYTPSIPSIAARIGKLNYSDDETQHIKVIKPSSDFMKKMVTLCPTRCYSIENDKVMIQHEGCIECGTCSEETDWKHTRGEKGITYQYG
jgi:ferredoxin-like protein FixX